MHIFKFSIYLFFLQSFSLSPLLLLALLFLTLTPTLQKVRALLYTPVFYFYIVGVTPDTYLPCLNQTAPHLPVTLPLVL